MLTKFKQLTKDSITYSLGSIISSLIGFFLIPVYTRVFAPSDYGIIELLLTVNGFLMLFVTLGTTAAQTRYFYDSERKEHKREIVSTLLYFRLLWGAVVVGMCMLAASTFNQFIFKGEVPNTYFYLVFLSALFSAILSSIVEVYRLLLRPKPYLALTLSHSLLGTCFIILLVVYLKQGVMGYLVGHVVSILVIVPVAIFLLRDYIRPKFSRPLLAKSLKFCVPLLPNGIAIWIITFSDRYFLILYTTLNEVGLYAVGAKFGLAIGLITGSFRLAWTPLALSVAKEHDAKAFYRNVATIYLVGLSFITIVLTGLSKLLMIVMTQPDYYAGYTVIGILAYGAVFYGLYTISGLGMWLSKKTIFMTIAIFVSAVLNVALNILLIPVWGMLGAATATLCAYMVGNGLAFYFGEKCYHIGFNYIHLGVTALVTCLGIALQLMLLATNWSLSLQYGLILIIWAVIGLLFTFRVIGRGRIESVIGAVRTYLEQNKK
jgi:O-antigen/teichoic acid export membrane protein